MNATGCVTALGDGGEAFVVLLADDHCYRGRGSRPEEMAMSLPCPAGRPPVPRPPMTTAEAYKSRPRRKDRGAFVVLPEPPPLVTAQANSTAKSSAATGSDCSGRVSPFRGHGFKTPEHGRSRASTPPSSSSSSFKHLRRQLSEPRITAGRRQRPVVANQRLSVSTKDLSMAVDKSSLPRNNNSSPRIPNKQLGLPKLLPAEKSGATATGRQPAVLNRQTNVSTNKTANVSRSAVANRHPPPPIKSSPRLPKKQSKVSAVEVTKKSKANSLPQPPIKSSPSSSKKQSTVATAEVTTSKTNSLPASKGDARLSDNNPQAAVTIPIASESLISVAAVPKTTVSTSVAVSTLMTAFTSTNEPTSTTMTVPTTMVAASTSATAIAATHVTNAAALPVVKSDGPIVTAAPPPAAIAVNTLATMSFVNSSNASKPPPSATRFRELPSVTDQPAHSTATVVVVDGGMSADTTTIQQPAHINVMTTTPPLSYELEEIVVEPEMENQSGRSNGISRLQASGDEGVQNNNIVLSTSNSSNGGHKTVAWARQSEKIIVPAEGPRPKDEPVAARAPAYKRFARKLCGGDRRRRPAAGKETPATDSRSSKCWTCLWKRRPRLKKRSAAVTTATATATAAGDRRCLRWCCCCCCGKKPKKPAVTSSSGSIGALGIAPPTVPARPTDTFCAKLKRRMFCCRCAAPKFIRRLCCGCCSRGGPDRSDATKNRPADDKRSLLKCTGCCTNIPKLDAVFVDHSSVMKGAIPVLPISLAWLCLVFNVIVPGSGTLSSGMLCLCVGKPRFTVNDTLQSRMGAFCVNCIVAAAQLFTVLFCLVGWGWSIWWGVLMLKMAKKYQKVRLIEHPAETPTVAMDQNHQI